MKYAKRKKLTRYDVLIIASMIEREAQLRARAPARLGRHLQPAQAGYAACGSTPRSATRRTIGSARSNSPSSTSRSRTTRGSTAGCRRRRSATPGLASIKAAAKPANKRYLFYVRKPGKSGEHAFSSTDAQFAKDVAKYQASRDGR